MISLSINLNVAEAVKEFVQIVSKYDYPMDVRSGRYVVNAKSILGIFSLELGKPIVLEIFDNDADDLIEELKPYYA